MGAGAMGGGGKSDSINLEVAFSFFFSPEMAQMQIFNIEKYFVKSKNKFVNPISIFQK